MHDTEAMPAALYRRRPTSTRAWLCRAELDFATLGQVERVLECPPEILAAAVRVEPARYAKLLQALAALVERQVIIVDAATLAHEAILAAMTT